MSETFTDSRVIRPDHRYRYLLTHRNYLRQALPHTKEAFPVMGFS